MQISWILSHFYNKCLTKAAQKKGAYFSSEFQRDIREDMWLEQELASHMTSTLRNRERGTLLLSSSSSLLQSMTPVRECHRPQGAGFPSSTNVIEIIPTDMSEAHLQGDSIVCWIGDQHWSSQQVCSLNMRWGYCHPEATLCPHRLHRNITSGANCCSGHVLDSFMST